MGIRNQFHIVQYIRKVFVHFLVAPCNKKESWQRGKKQSKGLLHGKKDDYKLTVLIVMSVKLYFKSGWKHQQYS